MNPGFRSVHTTPALMEYLGIPGDYEALRRMNQTDVLSQYGKFITHILASTSDASLLIDSHYDNLIRGQIQDRTGPWLSMCRGLIFISANSEQTLTRIEHDQAKPDRALFPEGLNREQQLKMIYDYSTYSRTKFRQTCSALRLPGVIIENRQGELKQTVDVFLQFAEQVTNHNNV